MPQDAFEAFRRDRERRRQAFKPRPVFETPTLRAAEGEETELFSFSDLALAPLRGAEGAVRGVLGLVDLVPGIDTGISEDRILGRSESVVGSLMEGITQFALGFIPGAGLAGRLSKMGFIPKSALVQRAVAGAITDFSAFDGNESRLSNLIEAFPALQNPVTAFLAADENDTEAEGRLKNALEGLGIGAAIDLFLGGLKGLRAQRRARTVDATPEDVARAVQEAIDPKSLEEKVVFADPIQDEAESVLARRRERERKAGGEEPEPEPTPEPEAKTKEAKAQRAEELLRGLLSDPDEAADIVTQFTRRQAEGSGKRANPRKLDPEEAVAERLSRANLNTENIRGLDDLSQMIRAFEDVIDVASEGHKVVPIAEQAAESAKLLRDYTDLPEEVFVEKLVKELGTKGTARQARIRMLALTSLHEAMAKNYIDAIRKASLGDPESVSRLMQTGRIITGLGRLVRAEQGEFGRGLRALGFRRTAPAFNKLGEAAADIAANLMKLGGADDASFKRWAERMKMAYDSDGPEATATLLKLHNATIGQKAMMVTTEFFINSILGAARTHVTNLMSAGILGPLLSVEKMVGGAWVRNNKTYRQGLRELLEINTGVMDSLKLAWKATRGGKPILDPEAAFRDDPAAALGVIRARNFGLDPNSVSGKTVDWIGKFVRLPSAILRGSDEFVKQMTARVTVRSSLIEEGIAKGLSVEDAVRQAEERMERILVDGQFATREVLQVKALKEAETAGARTAAQKRAFIDRYVNERIDEGVSKLQEEALARAREVTLTTPLESGTITGDLSRVLNQHPIFRLIVPFVRTPVNIAKFAGQRLDAITPVKAILANRFPSQFQALEESRLRNARALASGDPGQRAELVGRYMTGMSLTVLGATLASSGMITGRGPDDPELRRAMMDAGWQPYAIKIGDGYLQYLRADPIATFLGLMADFWETTALGEADDDPDRMPILAAIATTVSNNITQRTFLQGIQQLVDALADPRRKMPALLEQYAGTVIPNSLAQLTLLAGDDLAHESYTMIDRIRSRVPFLSKTAPVRRNVLGEPVRSLPARTSDAIGRFLTMFSPLTYTEVSDDVLVKEFAQLRHGFNPPRPRYLGLDLRDVEVRDGQNAYDRWQELHGQVRLRGKTLRQALREAIRDPEYRRLDPASSITGPSPRVNVLNRIIRKYRQAALEQLMKEAPLLRRELLRREQFKVDRRKGLTRV